jgi:transglutaminase-like putative cysteine protease
MVLSLYVHPERAGDLIAPETLALDPVVPVEDFIDGFGNRSARILAPVGQLRIAHETLIADSGLPDARDILAPQNPVEALPASALPFLFGSRYCEVDRLSSIAWDLFGKVPPGWLRVQAICDWIHANVQFGYKFARNNKTALDTYTERCGVCRDFMHLAITFCRAMNIPARYATGYLSDIGESIPDPTPMDFSAFVEVYLGDRWWPVDARHNCPRIGRVLMARGRDAVDVALTTSFGPTKLVKFKVLTEPASAPAELRKAG